MLFQHSLVENILSGKKSQTRRPVKPGDNFVNYGHRAVISVTKNGASRVRYVVGQDYAVQPKRGAGCIVIDGKPLRILITDIRFEDVRNISDADAVAEGFNNALEFLQVWTAIYDKKAHFKRIEPGQEAFCMALLKQRPADLYQGWALTFRVV